MNKTWRPVHLVPAAFLLGGLITLTMVAVVAQGSLDADGFRKIMVGAA